MSIAKTKKNHQYWMEQALQLAEQAALKNEVPVGAVITLDNKLVAQAHNLTISLQDPTAHAEILTIRQACEYLQNYRLNNCCLYVTLEPCCMCAGAIVHARLKEVIYAAEDKRVGAAGSVFHILGDARQYHQPEIHTGVAQERATYLLKDFFDSKRK